NSSTTCGRPLTSSSPRRKCAMGVLSTKLRCRACGARLPDGDGRTCPTCFSELADVGIWSELTEWGETRKKGRAHFIRKTIKTSAFATLISHVTAYLKRFGVAGLRFHGNCWARRWVPCGCLALVGGR